MKHVQKFKSSERVTRQSEKVTRQSGRKSRKKAVQISRRQMKQPMTPDPKTIPGVDYLEEPEDGAKPIAGPFWVNQLDLLSDAAQSASDRFKQGVFVAPEKGGFTIFKRRATK